MLGPLVCFHEEGTKIDVRRLILRRSIRFMGDEDLPTAPAQEPPVSVGAGVEQSLRRGHRGAAYRLTRLCRVLFQQDAVIHPPAPRLRAHLAPAPSPRPSYQRARQMP